MTTGKCIFCGAVCKDEDEGKYFPDLWMFAPRTNVRRRRWVCRDCFAVLSKKARFGNEGIRREE